MKKTLLLLVVTLFNYSFSQKSQTLTYKEYLNPNTGFKGEITVNYAFTKCYDELVIAYGYSMNYEAFNYKGKSYSVEELGLSRSLKSHQTATKFKMKVYPKTNNSYYLAEVFDGSVLENYDIGCFGQTKTIANGKDAEYWIKESLNTMYAIFTIEIGYEGLLVDKATSLLIAQEKYKKYNEILNEYENSNASIDEKMTMLNEAEKNATSDLQKEKVKGLKNRLNNEKKEKQNEESKSKLVQNSNDDSNENKDTKAEDKDDEKEEENSTETNSVNRIITTTQTEIVKTADLSEEKRNAALVLGTTAVALASASSRFGLGFSYKIGDVSSYGPDLNFLFSDTFGMNLYYGFAEDETDAGYIESYDAVQYGGGFIFDFNKDTDGLGIGIDLTYSQWEQATTPGKYKYDFQEGNQLHLGFTSYLYFLKLGYAFPISSEILNDGKIDSNYESSGLFTIGAFIYF